MCCQQALPFIGFGFLDNLVMITVVGVYVESARKTATVLATMIAHFIVLFFQSRFYSFKIVLIFFSFIACRGNTLMFL